MNVCSTEGEKASLVPPRMSANGRSAFARVRIEPQQGLARNEHTDQSVCRQLRLDEGLAARPPLEVQTVSSGGARSNANTMAMVMDSGYVLTLSGAMLAP